MFVDLPSADEDHYFERIRAGLTKTVEGVLDAGRALIEAKAKLSHGEFQHLVKERCRFSARTVQTFMKIASHEVLSNPQHVALLPASWGTLAELSRFEPRELKHALSNHWVKPDMLRRDVPHLHKRVRIALGLRGKSPIRRAKPAQDQEMVIEYDEIGKETTTNAIIDAMAAETDASGDSVKRAAAYPARVTGRTRTYKLDPDRIFRVIAEQLQSIAPSCDMFDIGSVSPDVIRDTAPSWRTP